MQPLNHDKLSGRSIRDDYYTPTSLYGLIARFFEYAFADLACSGHAYQHRSPEIRPTYYQSDKGWEIGAPPTGTSIFCNPPGGKDTQLKYLLFDQAIDLRERGSELIWLVYNINSLQPLIRRYKPALELSRILLFDRRLEWENKGEKDTGSFFSSALIYLPSPDGSSDQFGQTFGHLGLIK